MVDRLIPSDYWLHHERYLRFASHAKAAYDAAKSPFITAMQCRELREREARWTIRAGEEMRIAKGME